LLNTLLPMGLPYLQQERSANIGVECLLMPLDTLGTSSSCHC
jgi:hypothetical protein